MPEWQYRSLSSQGVCTSVDCILVMRMAGDDTLNSLQNELVDKLNVELQKDPAGGQIQVHAGRKTVDESNGLPAAHELARAPYFEAALRRHGGSPNEIVDLQFDVKVRFFRGHPGSVTIKPEPKVIIWATGFGREDCLDPTHSYAGIPFWATDRFTTLRLRPIPPVVVISGARDGGLQDYLRVTTGRPSAESISRYLIDGTGWDARLKPFLRDAEDLAHRWWVWSGSKEFDHEIYFMLQREHTAAAN